MASNQPSAPPAPPVAPIPAPEPPYTPTSVWVKEVRYQDGSQKPYEAMFIDKSDRHSAKFLLPNGIEAAIHTISDFFFTDPFISLIVKNTNAYIRHKGKSVRDVSKEEILVFFSIYFYMGVVKLPAKADYWRSEGLWPRSPG